MKTVTSLLIRTSLLLFPEVQDMSADDSKPPGVACGKYKSENISFQQETTE